MENKLAIREFLAITRPLIDFSMDELKTVISRAQLFAQQAEETRDPILEKILTAMAEKAANDVTEELALRN